LTYVSTPALYFPKRSSSTLKICSERFLLCFYILQIASQSALTYVCTPSVSSARLFSSTLKIYGGRCHKEYACALLFKALFVYPKICSERLQIIFEVSPKNLRRQMSQRVRLRLGGREVPRNEAEGLRCGAKNNPPPLRGAPFAQRGLKLVCLTRTPHPPLTRSPFSHWRRLSLASLRREVDLP